MVYGNVPSFGVSGFTSPFERRSVKCRWHWLLPWIIIRISRTTADSGLPKRDMDA